MPIKEIGTTDEVIAYIHKLEQQLYYTEKARQILQDKNHELSHDCDGALIHKLERAAASTAVWKQRYHNLKADYDQLEAGTKESLAIHGKQAMVLADRVATLNSKVNDMLLARTHQLRVDVVKELERTIFDLQRSSSVANEDNRVTKIEQENFELKMRILDLQNLLQSFQHSSAVEKIQIAADRQQLFKQLRDQEISWNSTIENLTMKFEDDTSKLVQRHHREVVYNTTKIMRKVSNLQSRVFMLTSERNGLEQRARSLARELQHRLASIIPLQRQLVDLQSRLEEV